MKKKLESLRIQNLFHSHQRPDGPNVNVRLQQIHLTKCEWISYHALFLSCTTTVTWAQHPQVCPAPVCAFFLSGIRGRHRFGSELSFGRLIYEHRPRQWRAAELLKGTTTKKEDRVALFYQRGSFVLKKLLNKRTPTVSSWSSRAIVPLYSNFIICAVIIPRM